VLPVKRRQKDLILRSRQRENIVSRATVAGLAEQLKDNEQRGSGLKHGGNRAIRRKRESRPLSLRLHFSTFAAAGVDVSVSHLNQFL